MTHPLDQSIAERVRVELANREGRRPDWPEIALRTGLTVRQLRRRIYGEVAFTAGQLAAVATLLGKPADHFLTDAEQVVEVTT